MRLSVVYNTGMAGAPHIHLDVRVPHTHTCDWMKYDVTYAPTSPVFMTDVVSSRLISFNATHTKIPFSRWPFLNLFLSISSTFSSFSSHAHTFETTRSRKSSHTTLRCHRRWFPSLMYATPFRGS